MSLTRTAALALVAAALAAPTVAPVGAQSAADIFDDATLHDVHLFVNSKDLTQLRARFTENINMPADIQIDGTRVRNVAIRSRGGGSRNPTKLGLRVDFDRYVPNRRFRGLESLVLDNLWQDEALIREQLAMKLFRRMGEAAPKESFCRLFVNNQYQGLYSLVEELAPEFTARETGQANGFLFEYHYRFVFYGEDLGPGLDRYKEIFEPRSHESDSDETLYGPIRDLFHDMNDPDDAAWLDLVSPRMDLPQFMRMLAVESAVGEADGILGYAGMNNFYLFRPDGSSPHRLFPWDRDLAFRFLDTSILTGMAENIIFRRGYAHADLRTAYLDAVDAAAHLMMDENWLENEIDRMVALIDTAARQDTFKQFTNAQFDEQIEFIRQLARTRPALLIEEVRQLRLAGGSAGVALAQRY